MAKSHSLVPLAIFMSLFRQAMSAGIDPNWYDGHATFYGNMNGGETMRKYNITLPFSLRNHNHALIKD